MQGKALDHILKGLLLTTEQNKQLNKFFMTGWKQVTMY